MSANLNLMQEVKTEELRTVEGGFVVLAGVVRVLLAHLGNKGVTPSDKEAYIGSFPPEGG